MKKVKLISLILSMLICFVVKAQENTVSKDTISSVLANKAVICAPTKSTINEPLYIMDGILIDAKKFSKINPNDIQSIKILKGIEATSLYGNQGKNGVVVIETKNND